MIQGIKITQKDFKLIEGKITELLTPLKEFKAQIIKVTAYQQTTVYLYY